MFKENRSLTVETNQILVQVLTKRKGKTATTTCVLCRSCSVLPPPPAVAAVEPGQRTASWGQSGTGACVCRTGHLWDRNSPAVSQKVKSRVDNYAPIFSPTCDCHEAATAAVLLLTLPATARMTQCLLKDQEPWMRQHQYWWCSPFPLCNSSEAASMN